MRLSAKKRIIIVAAAVIILAAAAYLIVTPPGRRLVLTEVDGGRVCLRVGADYGDEFSVTFTHSVNKTDVTETYELREDGIYLTGCIYYGFGAGVATELEEGWRLDYGDNGEMIISGIDMKINDLIYTVGTVSDHILAVNGAEYSLRDECGRNATVRFTLE